MTEPCSKVRTGLGHGWTCRVHNQGEWPCKVGQQLGDQLAMLGDVAPLAPAVLAEIAAERRYAIEQHAQATDDARDAIDWIDLLASYLERTAIEAVHVRDAAILGDPDIAATAVARYRHRLVQTAGIAIAGVEAIDRIGA